MHAPPETFNNSNAIPSTTTRDDKLDYIRISIPSALITRVV